MGVVDLTASSSIRGFLSRALGGIWRHSRLSSGSARRIAPPAFTLAPPCRVEAMRGRSREGLRTTTFEGRSNPGGLLDAPVVISAPAPSKSTSATVGPCLSGRRTGEEGHAFQRQPRSGGRIRCTFLNRLHRSSSDLERGWAGQMHLPFSCKYGFRFVRYTEVGSLWVGGRYLGVN
jgi:hypothetical protein